MEAEDFGFTFDDDQSLDKATEIYNAVLPFLKRLAEDETKDMIKWPGKDRVAQVNALIKKINDIIGIKAKRRI